MNLFTKIAQVEGEKKKKGARKFKFNNSYERVATHWGEKPQYFFPHISEVTEHLGGPVLVRTKS